MKNGKYIDNEIRPVVKVGGFTAYEAKHLQDEGRHFDIKVSIVWRDGVRVIHIGADGEYYDYQSAFARLQHDTEGNAEPFTLVEDVEGLIQLPFPMHPSDYKDWRKTKPELNVINPYPHGQPDFVFEVK